MTGLLVFLLLGGAVVILGAPSARLRGGDSPPDGPRNGGGIREAPLILDLLGALLSAGSSVEHALSVIAESCDPDVRSSLARVHAARLLGASWDAAWDAGPAVGPHPPSTRRRHGRRTGPAQEWDAHEVRRGLRFATSTGAPSAALLHAHAAQLRRRHNREIERRAAALGVQLVLPLGLCSLPAFICLGVVPVVLGLLPDLQR